MTDGPVPAPDPVPEAPWRTDATAPAPAPGPQPGQQLPNEQMSPGGIAVPGQAPPPPPAPAPDPNVPQPAADEQGLACHRSWLMGMRPAARQKAPTIDPRTHQIIDVGGQEEIIMVPVPSPYACIGPACSLWHAGAGKCLDVVVAETQLAVAQSQLEMPVALDLTAPSAPATAEAPA